MSDIKIFVSCHKPSKVLDNKLLYPIQVGTELSNKKFGDLHDNDVTDGIKDDISHKNRYYCELTAQYWVWKHVDADYYGFFHYRRYLSFKKYCKCKIAAERGVENLDDSLKETENLNEEAMQNYINKYDVIMPRKAFALSNKLQYAAAINQHYSDLKTCIDIIDEYYPHMKKVAHKFLRQNTSYYCNIFIMKKEIFHNYCEWLFDILQKHEEKTNLSEYNTQEFRVSGYLAERLCAIYANWLQKQKKYKIGKLELIKFANCDLPQNIEIKSDEIPFVVHCKDANKTAMTMASAQKNSANKLKFIILEKSLSQNDKNLLQSISSNVVFVKQKQDILRTLKHLKEISNINKFVFAEDDILITKDLDKYLSMYNKEDYDIFGSIDIDYISNWFGFDKKAKKFQTKNIKIDYREYINTNFCILNLKSINLNINTKNLNTNQILNLCSTKKIIAEFDLINKFDCAGKRKLISYNYAPYEIHQKYLNAKPVALDYSFISEKYYDDGINFDKSQEFWSLARTLPNYESILRCALAKKPNSKQKRKLRRDKFKKKLFKPGSFKEVIANTYTRWLAKWKNISILLLEADFMAV